MSVQGKRFGSSSKKSSVPKQEDNTEKVRVLKERQSQWMRQRDEAKSSTSGMRQSSKSTSSVGSSHGSRKSTASEFEYESGARDPVTNPRRKPLYEPPKRDNSNVISWSGAADNTGKAKRPSSARSQKQATGSRSTKLDSSRSKKSESGSNKAYEPLNYGSNVKSSADLTRSAQAMYNKLGPISSKQGDSLLQSGTGIRDEAESEERYREMQRDSSPKSVNMDKLHEHNDHTDKLKSMSQDLNPEMINALAETVAQRLKTTLHSDRRAGHVMPSNQEHEEDMSTHVCPMCRTLMSGTRHTPVALIPCGHTFCQVCVRDCRKCPNCQARVKSTAVNTVMQQIIGDFKEQKEKERLQKLEEQTRKYIEEYQSLSLRSDALADEAEIILNVMEEATEKIFQEKKTVKKIEVDDEELIQRISELQNKLSRNKARLSESQDKCRNLEQKYDEEKQRLSLVEDTIKTISQSKERVKMLVRNFAPDLNFDHFE